MPFIPQFQKIERYSSASEHEYSFNNLDFLTLCSQPTENYLDQPEDLQQERVIVFVDGSNLFYAALHLKIEIDYFKLLNYLVRGRRLLRAYFYTGVDPANDKQRGFLLWMSRNGYRVISKDLIQLSDGTRKANLDVEIAVDMVSISEAYDTAILVSGDGDLAYAANAIAYKGVRVEVVSLYSMTSETLLNVADQYTDLTHIQRDICKTAPPKP